MRRHSIPVLLAALIALAAAGCGGSVSKAEPAVAPAQPARSCPAAWKAGWQKLADRIRAPVYCPSWLPDPLTGEIGGRWNIIDSVDPDRSYLVGFAWQERDQEIHVNLRAYPGRTAVPKCRSIELVGGRKHVGTIPCFSDRRGTKRLRGLTATMYTVNQDADQWHVLYTWRYRGSLYTVSQHVAPPLSFPKVVQSLDRITRGLVLVDPGA